MFHVYGQKIGRIFSFKCDLRYQVKFMANMFFKVLFLLFFCPYKWRLSFMIYGNIQKPEYIHIYSYFLFSHLSTKLCRNMHIYSKTHTYSYIFILHSLVFILQMYIYIHRLLYIVWVGGMRNYYSGRGWYKILYIHL